jgi:hypothetical protein
LENSGWRYKGKTLDDNFKQTKKKLIELTGVYCYDIIIVVTKLRRPQDIGITSLMIIIGLNGTKDLTQNIRNTKLDWQSLNVDVCCRKIEK